MQALGKPRRVFDGVVIDHDLMAFQTFEARHASEGVRVIVQNRDFHKNTLRSSGVAAENPTPLLRRCSRWLRCLRARLHPLTRLAALYVIFGRNYTAYAPCGAMYYPLMMKHYRALA